MISLNELSTIGFGCHHVIIENANHELAITHALRNGCNLIDTSSNYQDGKSELLVGKILKDLPDIPCFIMTKGGNVSGDNLKQFNLIKSIDPKEVVKISNTAIHCIQPDYLKVQIETSLKRMNRTMIDGYFLHNPEYYMLNDSNADEDIYYERIKRAFEFLENQVKNGIIRYYGISESTGVTNFSRLLNIASEVCSSNHFKLMQFPFNLIERGFSTKKNGSDYSELDLMKKHGIATFGNRPLTIRYNDKIYKVIKYNHPIDEIDVLSIMNDAFEEMEKQIDRRKLNVKLTDLEIVNYLYKEWKYFESESNFVYIYENIFMACIRKLYSNDIPFDSLLIFQKFETQIRMYLQNRTYKESKEFFQENGFNNLFASKNLIVDTCKMYLKHGPDHILIGMRDKKYVDEISSIMNT